MIALASKILNYMALKFRLRGLAETFIDHIDCPSCGTSGSDDQNFTTEFTKVTLEGIIVIAQCKSCGEIFVPDSQRLGIMNPPDLKAAVQKDSNDTGEPICTGIGMVKLTAEKMNAARRGGVH